MAIELGITIGRMNRDLELIFISNGVFDDFGHLVVFDGFGHLGRFGRF